MYANVVSYCSGGMLKFIIIICEAVGDEAAHINMLGNSKDERENGILIRSIFRILLLFIIIIIVVAIFLAACRFRATLCHNPTLAVLLLFRRSIYLSANVFTCWLRHCLPPPI